MATSKKIQGALSLVPPTEEEAIDYNGQMSDLMGQLVQDPEQQRKDELLAWGGGLTDPNGNFGGALINATKAQSDHRHKDRQLRVQYIPMIMNALAAQQQAAQLSRLAQQGGAGGANQLIGMDPNQVPVYARINGIDVNHATTLWKEANKPDAMQSGTVQRFPRAGGGFEERWIADPKNPVVVNPQTNEMTLAPGGLQTQARIAGATKQAEQRAIKGFDFLEGETPSGQKYRIPLREAKPEWFQEPGDPAAAPKPAQPPGPTPPLGGAGTLPQTSASAPMPPATAGAGGPQGQPRGNFQGNPSDISMAIANIKDPVERENALKAFENQMRGTNPAYVPEGSEPPGNQGPGAIKPVVVAGSAPAGDLPPGAMTTGMAPAEKMRLENIAASNKLFQEKMFPETLTLGGKVADERLVAIDQARTALKELGSSGWGTETKHKAARILGAFGVPQAQEFSASAETFQRAVYENNFQGLATQNGVQTEGDAQRYAKTYASLGNTAKANALIFDTAQAIAERDKMKADYYRKALPLAQKSTGDLQEIDRRWARVAPSIFKMPSMRRWASKE
jgi:hypothetical protein